MYSFILYLISKCFQLDSFTKNMTFRSGFTTKESLCIIIPGCQYVTLSLDQNCFTKITVIFRYLFMITSVYHVSFKTIKIHILYKHQSVLDKWFVSISDFSIFYFSSVQLLNHGQLFGTPWTAAHQASITNSWSCSDSCPFSLWCHPTISCSVIPFSSCLQSFPASGSIPMSQFFI